MQIYWSNSQLDSGEMRTAKWSYRYAVFLPSMSPAGFEILKFYVHVLKAFKKPPWIHTQNSLISRGFKICVTDTESYLSCHQNIACHRHVSSIAGTTASGALMGIEANLTAQQINILIIHWLTEMLIIAVDKRALDLYNVGQHFAFSLLFWVKSMQYEKNEFYLFDCLFLESLYLS